MVGDTAYSKARNAVHKKTGIERAVKVIPKSKIQNPADMEKNFANLKALNHPNLCRVFELYQDENNYYMVNEKLSGEDIIDVLLRREKFEEKDAAYVL